jgi:hypothetical protein
MKSINKQQQEEIIHDLLLKLGRTKEEVAQNLSSLGIKGIQSISASCPISNYLSRELKGIIATELSNCNNIKIIHYLNEDKCDFDEYELPSNFEQIATFVYAFDAGDFPELIEKDNEDNNAI